MRNVPVHGESITPSIEREISRPSSTNAPAADFGAELGKALGAVEELQVQSDAQATQAALGAGNLHELSIAMEKADVAMRVATKVRNKVVEAYHELMRTTV